MVLGSGKVGSLSPCSIPAQVTPDTSSPLSAQTIAIDCREFARLRAVLPRILMVIDTSGSRLFIGGFCAALTTRNPVFGNENR